MRMLKLYIHVGLERLIVHLFWKIKSLNLKTAVLYSDYFCRAEMR